MNQLDKLIEQYESENPGNLARNSYYCLPTNKYIEFYTDKFMEWQLANRPTCGVEQRKFLDELEKKWVYLDEEKCICPAMAESESTLWQDEFMCDLQKVIKGK